MARPKQKTCQRCNAACGCGAVEGNCWCMDQPYRLPMPSRDAESGRSQFTDCFCPTCLREVAEAAGLSRRPAQA